MDKQDLASMLDGRSYGFELSRDEARRASADGLVVVYGASDDLMEFEGAIIDEVGVYNGGVAYLDASGVLDRDQIDDGDDKSITDYSNRIKSARSIKAVWGGDGGPSWCFETDIPHEIFTIVALGEPYCRGIVFSLSDLDKVVTQ
jgi:hypothetical protein